MTTETEFFKGKRPWSKIKDAVLRDYLPPYLAKVGTLGKEIVLIDAFAGPGIYEEETGPDRQGSPLIILENAEKYVPGRYFAIFVNSVREHHRKLERAISGFSSSSSFKVLHSTAQELLGETKKVLTNQTLFIYLDPWGLKDLDFRSIEPFLQRGVSYSTEILINMSMPTLHRLATRKVQRNGRQTEKSKRLNETLTKVLHGDYWKEIMWGEGLTAEQKELRVIEKYRQLLLQYLPYSGSCPVREKEGKHIKYFITFCSRHPDAMLLMNDSMCKAYYKYVHEQYYQETIFQDTDWKQIRDLTALKDIIMDEIEARQRITRIQLWRKIVQAHFMRYHSSEYKRAIQQLCHPDEKKLDYKHPKDRRQLSDDCILFRFNGNSGDSSASGFLIKEQDSLYQDVASKSRRAIMLYFDRYTSAAKKVKVLLSRVNDGSIIKRFEKTPFPRKLTDVICPHFLELKWAYGCPYDCAWCYLKGTFRFHNGSIMPGFKVKDFDKVRLHVEQFLNNVNEPEILNAGEIADSLMYENSRNPFSKFIIPIFERQTKHKVLFVTKSDRITNLLEITPHRQVIISFSLNAIPVAERWEKGAPGVLKRVEAAKKLAAESYEVRIRLDPMVPIDNWAKYYTELVDLIFSNFTPERMTLGSLRGLQSTLNGTKDSTWKVYLKESSGWGKKIDFTTRLRMYSDTIGYLKDKYNYSKIALCKETKAMWQKLSMDYRKIKCNCTW